MASIKITLSLFLFLAIFTYTKAKLGFPKETKMTVFYHDYSGEVNATTISIPVPGPVNFTKFGNMFVHDIPITKGREEDSTPVARGRGMFVITSKDGQYFHQLTSVQFINSKYNGSTLEIQGNYEQFGPVAEVAVVGGTGKFRLARGYATFETLFYDTVSGYAIFRSNMTVLHY